MPPAERRARPRSAKAPARASALQQLADRVGIIPEYLDQTGTEKRQTSDETRVALLAAMGIDASGDAAARRALEELESRDRDRLVSPVRVVQRGQDAGVLRLAGDQGWPASVDWEVEIVAEDGATRRESGRAARRKDGCFNFGLPSAPDLGYHTLRVQVQAGGRVRNAEQLRIVVPPSCPRAGERLQRRRVFGLIANLYTVRSARNWGAGDTTDLADLLSWTAEVGGAFVGVNPLHALRNRGSEISPYSPVSRLYRNALYLDIEAVPEFQHSPEARALTEAGAFIRERDRLRRAARLDYHVVAALRQPLLQALHRTFRDRAASGDGRAAAYRAYLAREGDALRDFATFCAIEDWLGEQAGAQAPSWRAWPAELRDSRSEAVARFRQQHEERVDLHAWIQFEIDCQLANVARRGRDAGMPIGLYQDLAIGTSPDGSDPWMFPGMFLDGVSIGAPPDPYAAGGQNWGLPPLDPRALHDDRYRYWTQLVRSALRHSGALRIDHVMGLFRQFWIPAGRPGSEGAYVRFPSEDLLGILALEATRANAIVVGEDLGTVPEDVPPAMERWGLLSSKVLYFERDRRGDFKASASYPREALATANTHDMPTVAGFWAARDVELRRETGLVSGKEASKAVKERVAERAKLVELLVDEGILDPEERDPSTERLRTAVHMFLRRTPSYLVGLSLDDLVGETEPVNLPGVGPEKFPSWTRRLGVGLEQLRSRSSVRRVLGAERVWIP
jgi:4-alpha-glucanotransferase